ncbi:isopenicillin N synthase family oxygenase [Microbispora sp. NEAU-D428]|uniref:isopenicillin N synthase family dioxygenase n=1 Tax=Microbispora sitophila TaxID=2771537 RepID=UPI0018662CE8|nr:isopenicillin N synthase family oxygenase [Microbispora sitophila]MBE3016051.1 isopenicillin N synthase family oxygenase [Microbispora sitophila]
MPTIELSAFISGTEETRLEISSAVDAACRTTGFFLIIGHGVPGGLMNEVYRRSREFFDLPAEVKHSYYAEGHGLLGYRGMNSLRASTSSASDSPYDAKELYSIGQEYPPAHLATSHAEFFPPNIWPRGMVGFRAALLAYYDAMCQLTEPLGELFATALGLPGDYFACRSEGQLSWLASINYPSPATAPVEPGQWRFGAHRDRSCFTILSTSGPGLEVEDAYGVWHPVPVRPDAFIVNVGSMLAGWTGGRWTAPMHRVSSPRADASPDQAPSRRQSLAFFYSPDPTVTLDPLPTSDCGEPHTLHGRTLTVADHLRSLLGLYK